jgi:hypothetical protein
LSEVEAEEVEEEEAVVEEFQLLYYKKLKPKFPLHKLR